MTPIAAFVISGRSVGGDNLDAKGIGFHRHPLERPAAWDTVAVGFKTNGLVTDESGTVDDGVERGAQIENVLTCRVFMIILLFECERFRICASSESFLYLQIISFIFYESKHLNV